MDIRRTGNAGSLCQKNDRPGYRMDSACNGTLIIVDSGLDSPLRLVFFEEGMVGVGGCFDTSLTNRWIITQEKVLKSFKNSKKA